MPISQKYKLTNVTNPQYKLYDWDWLWSPKHKSALFKVSLHSHLSFSGSSTQNAYRIYLSNLETALSLTQALILRTDSHSHMQGLLQGMSESQDDHCVHAKRSPIFFFICLHVKKGQGFSFMVTTTILTFLTNPAHSQMLSCLLPLPSLSVAFPASSTGHSSSSSPATTSPSSYKTMSSIFSSSF